MSQQRRRRSLPPTPEQIARMAVRRLRPSNAELAWEQASAAYTLGPNRVAIGVVQHHGTRHFHAVLSLYGSDLTTVGVFAQMEPANTLAEAFGDLFIHWHERRPGESEALLDWLNAEAAATSLIPTTAWVLPDRQVRAFLAQVARTIQREN